MTFKRFKVTITVCTETELGLTLENVTEITSMHWPLAAVHTVDQDRTIV